MASASDWLENAILNHIFGKSPMVSPFGLYMALATAVINDSDTGATLSEASYTGYTRAWVPAASWDSAAGGLITNNTLIVFPTNTGTSQVMTHGCMVATGPARLTSGVIYLKDALGANITVDNGENVRFEPGVVNWSAA